MNRRRSLTVQLASVMLVLVLAIIVFFWIMNNTLLEKYYVYNKEEEMLSVYKMVDQAAVTDQLSSEVFALTLKKKCDSGNIDVVVFNKYGKVIIEGTSDSDEVFQLLLEASLSTYPSDYADLNMNRKKDEKLGTEYIIINNRLVDGNFVYMKTPLESIRESVKLLNRFFGIGALVAILTGTSVVIFLSRSLSKPIRHIMDISTKMSKLDFEAKYIPAKNEAREISELGEHMNELSNALESTITELKRANNELKRDIRQKEEIDSMRREFLSNVSHELKTPLTLISGYAEGLKEAVNDDEQSRDYYCEVIMDEADKMNRMVMKLLSLNQLEFGNDNVDMERFNITELIKAIVSSSKLLLEKNNLTIEFAENEPIYVCGDIFKIEEVLTNYITNAINHCTCGGMIVVRYVFCEEIVRISVFNQGKPIPVEEIDKIWTKFYKVDKARTREYGGSGIGLSIVKAIMDSHNRQCGVINHEDGVEFWFELELFT